MTRATVTCATMTRSALVAACALVALSGCASPDEPVQDLAADAAPDEEVPDVFGLVLDQDGDRLPGATVAIPARNASTRSDANGSFAFVLEEPVGRYEVIASKDGYRDASADVRLAQGLAAHIVFTLVDVDNVPELRLVDSFRGFLPCHAEAAGQAQECPLGLSGDRFDTFHFPLDYIGEDPLGLVVEVFWEPGLLEHETLRVELSPFGDGPPAVTAEGGPGLRVHLDKAALDNAFGAADRAKVHVRAAPGAYPVNVHLQQEFEVLYTLFYGQPAPDGYTIADA